tara:strand:+ start:8097 stop:9002 length:906 start_codon:yes stop_codon:yes gene_type:complete
MLELQFNNIETFSFKKGTDKKTVIQLPSAGIVLTLSPELASLLTLEAERFLRETLTHSRYIATRFKYQTVFVSSLIHKLFSDNLMDHNGFTDKALSKGKKTFSYDVESIIELITYSHYTNKTIKDELESLDKVVHGERYIKQWPSIKLASELPTYDKSLFKQSMDNPIRLTSSGTLAGLVKPIIFHDGSLDMAFYGCKVKAYLSKDDGFKLLNALLDVESRAMLLTAYKGWSALSQLSDAISQFIKTIEEGGFNTEFGHFEDDQTDVSIIYKAISELIDNTENEKADPKLNKKIGQLFIDK